MRIVFHSRFPADENNPRGGVESATCNLLHGLKRIGYDDLHVVTLEKKRSTMSVENHELATVHRLPAGHWPMIVDIFMGPGRRRLKKYIRELGPDVVHFHETHGLAMSGLGLPSVFTLHGFDTENLGTERKYAWRSRTLAWHLAERLGLRRRRHMISIAPYVRDKVRSYTSATIYDISNAIAGSGFEVERAEEGGMIFFAGWISRRKNSLGLVRAFAKVQKQHPESRLELAGEFSDPEYKKEVQQAIADLGLSEKVELLGHIPADAVRGKLAKASLFVLPSFQENAPMVVAEAMAAGVPVVTSNVCGMPDMIADGESGILVDPNSVDDLAAAIIGLLSSDEMRAEISRQGKKSALEKFHPETVAKQTITVYENVIAEHKSVA